MVEHAPLAAGPGDGGAEISAASLSEALGALKITSAAALPRSASPADSGIDEAGAPQLLQEKAGPPKKDANDAKVEPHGELIKAAVRPSKKAKAGAKLGSKARKAAVREKVARYASIIEYFDATYESNQDKLAGWQLLCEHVGVEPGPSIVECKKVAPPPPALKEVFINICDFVACMKGGPPFERFCSADALRTYTLSSGKVFPLWPAKKRPILRSMLIEIF
ncbi:hypothetical protein LTR12_001464 [Friedmanniomyces endolithicus]|nr:hypothetical protein LTR74_002909 [Friedmanniomyces endolithicus]KAK1824163.1 hypothetical protein LTR12_001464 [Friedmanniomyces endolithicus]